MGDIPDEDKVKIANAFLLASPPGEFTEVVTDVRALVENDGLLNESSQSTYHEYNTTQMVACTPQDYKYKVLITAAGEIDQEHYLDPKGKKVVSFDHIKSEAGEVRDATEEEMPESLETLRAAVEKNVSNYVDDFYPHGGFAVYAKDDEGKTKITICISSAKFNPGNYWNGRWRSVWTVSVGEEGSKAELSGRLLSNVHYYEDGNVQFESTIEKSQDINVKSDEETGKSIAAVISKHEAAFQVGLAEQYIQLSDNTFKQLRRKLPITKDKIDWTKMNGYKLGSELK